MTSKKWLVLGLLLAIQPVSHALASRGGEGSGGGDLCEDRIKIIRDDLKNWIVQGGPNGLTLPIGISVEQYSKQMLTQIAAAKISCVGPQDRGFPVMISGTPKVCRFDRAGGEQITCDFLKFNATSESDQYVLIHHEFSGLAGMEQPNKADSHYEISNQISDYLEDVVVKRLAVKPKSKNKPSGGSISFCVSSYTGAGFKTYCPGQKPFFTSTDGVDDTDNVGAALDQKGFALVGAYYDEGLLLSVDQADNTQERFCVLAQSEKHFLGTPARNIFDCSEGAVTQLDDNATDYLKMRGYELIYSPEAQVNVMILDPYFMLATLHVYKKSSK